MAFSLGRLPCKYSEQWTRSLWKFHRRSNQLRHCASSTQRPLTVHRTHFYIVSVHDIHLPELFTAFTCRVHPKPNRNIPAYIGSVRLPPHWRRQWWQLRWSLFAVNQCQSTRIEKRVLELFGGEFSRFLLTQLTKVRFIWSKQACRAYRWVTERYIDTSCKYKMCEPHNDSIKCTFFFREIDKNRNRCLRKTIAIDAKDMSVFSIHNYYLQLIGLHNRNDLLLLFFR